MRIRLMFVVGTMVALLSAAVRALAHHSFSAVYDGNKPVTLRGFVSKLGWQNPHAHIYVDVKNPTTGQMVTWEVESAGASNLLRAGLRREDFVGAEVLRKGLSGEGRHAGAQRQQLHAGRSQEGDSRAKKPRLARPEPE